MTTMKRNLTRGLLPALFLTAALSVPVAGMAAPWPNGKAHAADKVKKNEARQERQNARRAEQEAAKAFKAQREAQKAQRRALRAQQQIVVRQAAPRRVIVQQQRVVVPRGRVVVVPRNQVVVTPQPVYVARNRYRWNGWNNNRYYSRYGTDTFQLDGTYIGQQYGCALLQDGRGQVIPLLNNPGDLRRGDHLQLTGRIQNSSVCGTAFRIFNVDAINGSDYYSYRGRYNDRYNNNNRYNNNGSYDNGYYDDRYRSNGNRDLVSIVGRLDDSGDCPAIRGDHGEYYDLVGDLRDFRDGDHAQVLGFLGSRSRCGGPAIDVQQIR